MNTPNSISQANTGHGVGAGFRKVFTQPIMGAVPELERKVELLQVSFRLGEISDHLIL